MSVVFPTSSRSLRQTTRELSSSVSKREAFNPIRPLNRDTLSIRFGNQAAQARPSLLQKSRDAVQYAFKRVWALLSYVIGQIKMGFFLAFGTLAFLPLTPKMRNWVERVAVFPPDKVMDLPFKESDALKAYTRKPIFFDLWKTVKKDSKPCNPLGFSQAEDSFPLRAWHIPAQAGKPTVLFNQQRSSNISYLGRLMKNLKDKGYGVFVYDYPGCGGSGGKSGEQAMYKAGYAASLKLATLDQNPVPFEQQIIMGYSLGTPVSAKVTETLQQQGHHPKALVLINGFPSLKKIVRHVRDQHWPMKYVVSDRAINRIAMKLDCESSLKKLDDVPVLFLQGEKDANASIGEIQTMRKQLPKLNSELVMLPGTYHRLKDADYDQIAEKFDAFMADPEFHSAKRG